MIRQSKTLIFFGNERLATGVITEAPVLRSLLDNGYEIDFLVVSQAAQRGRRRRELEVEAIAEAHEIEIYTPSGDNELAERIKASNASFAVLAAYGKLVSRKIIDCFEHGIINIHPSMLPNLRGTTPIETAILEGLEETGVSIMQLVAAMDAGPIYAQEAVALEAGISKQALADRLAEKGSRLLIDNLDPILNGKLEPAAQDEANATFTKMISKQDGQIDWSKSARAIEREVRAYLGWPGSKAVISGKELIVTEVGVADEQGEAGVHFVKNGRIIVYCSEDAIEIKKLKPAGKPEMTAEAFLAGNRI